jgi:ABC-type Zn uptake system ZnuABC Zn-binding protein ZnuA
MTPEMVLQMADSNNDSHISWDEFWVVFNSDEHDDDDHGDNHDDHNGSHDDMDEATEEYMMGLFYAAFNESDMYYYNGGSNDAGDGLLNISELAIFVEEIEHVEEDMESASITILLSMFDADDDGNLSLSEFTSFMETMNDDQDNHDGHNGSHDDHQEVCYDSSTGSINSAYDNQTDCEATGLVWTDMEVLMMEMMFNMYDNNSDGYINASELGMMMEMGDDGHHDEEHGVIGFANLHVEAEGEYGFLLPSDVTMHVLISRDAHEGHGHDDHDDHGDEDRDGHEDHDDHGDEDRDEHDDHDDHEEIPYDPHSWLDPLAFKVQIDIVLDALITAFPDGQESFTANANAYKVELDSLIDDFEDTFGEEGTCSGKDKTIVANHNAYSYLAQRYDIEFTTIHGVDPEGEPSAEDIAEVVETIEDKEITVFFVEEFTDPTSVDSIVSQSGVTVLYLYTMELPPSNDGDDYLSLMKKNLDNLTTGIGC